VAIILVAAHAVACASGKSNFIYVANAGEDTVSKIDVTTNTEVARYATWFTSPDPNYFTHTPTPPTTVDIAHQGPAPSRIARDSADNVYVLDRFFSSHLPVLLKIAPNGGNPCTTTSCGPTVLPITDTVHTTPVNIDPGEAKDVRILWAQPIGTTGQDEGKLGRAVCLDTSGFLWVGMYTTMQYYKVDPNTGITVAGPISVSPHTPYGCEVDLNGKLWSVDEHGTLAEIDTVSGTVAATSPHNHASLGANYSLSIYNDCTSSPPKVKVYLSTRGAQQPYIVYDPQTSTFSGPPPAFPTSGANAANFSSVSVGVDSQGNIISGEVSPGRVIKSTPGGTVLWDTSKGPPPAGPTQTVTNLHGIIIDDYDDVWAVDWFGNQVIKYSGVNGKFIQTVKVGFQPYTYGNPPPPTCSASASPSPTATATATPTATPGCAVVADKEVRCLPDGSYSHTFTVTNNSGVAISQVLLTPQTDGAFSLTPQLSNLGSPLANGQSTTLTTNIGHIKPGEKVCFLVSLLSDNGPCCMIQVCPTLPRCGELPTPIPSTTPQRR
jgi:hypothetical protein